MQLNKTLEKPMDLTQWAYIAIKEWIIDNEIEPGSQLKIEELTATLNVSRTPVREALLRLKQEGIVISVPRVGFFVYGMTKEEFEELFELRQIIECYAAEQAAYRMSDKEIANLMDIQERSNLVMQKGKIKEFNELEIELHDTIIQSLQNKKIDNVMSSVADSLYKERHIAMGSMDNLSKSIIEHGKIVKAIQMRDGSLSRKLMREHLSKVKDRLEQIIKF